MFRLVQCRKNRISCLFSMYYYSTNAAATALPHNNLLVEMLVNSLGLSRKKAISASSKATRLKPGKHMPKLVIDFFQQQVGLNKSHIKTLVSCTPKLLFLNVDKILKPKIKFLQDEVALSGSDLAQVVSKGGALLRASLDDVMRPNLDYLRKLFGNHDSVTKIVKRDPRILWCNAPKLMSPNIAFLLNNGFSTVDVRRLIMLNPRFLLMMNTKWLDNAVHRVENDLHIPRHSAMFIYGVIAIASLGESSLETRLETFRRFGWSDLDILTLAQKNPLCLCLSEAKIGKGLNFFMKELGYGASYLASSPVFLTCSLEKRVLPRHEILKLLDQKKLGKCSRNFRTVVKKTESMFLKDYVLPFKDEMPEVYELYMKSRR